MRHNVWRYGAWRVDGDFLGQAAIYLKGTNAGTRQMTAMTYTVCWVQGFIISLVFVVLENIEMFGKLLVKFQFEFPL
jgi:hypothetical protein